MWKVLKSVNNRKGKCDLVDKITVNNTDITHKQEISDNPRSRLGLWIAKQWTLWTSGIAECLFRLFDPSDSLMEEAISTTGPTDFEESLILTRRISLWKSNSVLKTSRSLNTVRQHASRIYASISIFTPYKPKQYFMKLFSCFWLDG